jgi:hypothetical protein
MVKSDLRIDVGATLVVAPLQADAVRKQGDHKGRPYSWQSLDSKSLSGAACHQGFMNLMSAAAG